MEWKGRKILLSIKSVLGKQVINIFYRINFNSYSREAKFPKNSEVLKLLREQEAAIARPGVEGMSALQENRNYNSNDVFLGTSFLFLILSPSTKNQIQSRTHVSFNPVIWLDGRQSLCFARKSKYWGSCSSARPSHQSSKTICFITITLPTINASVACSDVKTIILIVFPLSELTLLTTTSWTSLAARL